MGGTELLKTDCWGGDLSLNGSWVSGSWEDSEALFHEARDPEGEVTEAPTNGRALTSGDIQYCDVMRHSTQPPPPEEGNGKGMTLCPWS